MQDRIGVLQYGVRTTPVSGTAQLKVMARLNVMQTELARAQSAIAQMKHAVQTGQPGQQFASAVMDSRNWVLSLLASQSYVQEMLAPSGVAPTMGKGASLVAHGQGRALGPGGQATGNQQLAEYRKRELDSRFFPAVQLPRLAGAAVNVGIEDANRDSH